MCHQYGIFGLISQTSFGGETSGSVANVGCFLMLDNKSTDKGKLLSFCLVAGTLQGVIYACRHSPGRGTPDFK